MKHFMTHFFDIAPPTTILRTQVIQYRNYGTDNYSGFRRTNILDKIKYNTHKQHAIGNGKWNNIEPLPSAHKLFLLHVSLLCAIIDIYIKATNGKMRS